MLNKSRQEETTKCGVAPISEDTSAPLATRPLENGKDATLMSSIRAEAKRDSLVGTVTIGKTVKFVGQIYSKEDLLVDGDLEGTVEAIGQKITIGPNGTVHASVKAREVVVLGTLQGTMEVADRIEIGGNARVMGDIRMARIHIEDGAYFKGSIDIVKPESIRTPANFQAVVLAPAPNQADIAVGKQTDGGKVGIN
jgi:cytoskeletal protein CcmA (bactofilin family)